MKIECFLHEIENTDNWSKIMIPVLDAYNNSPHSIAKMHLIKLIKIMRFKY
jgi:hypothetical protein